MPSELIARALRQHAEDCTSAGHAGCKGTEECHAAVDEYEREHATDIAAEHFDIARVAAGAEGKWPDERWPTSALMRLVRDRMLEPPIRDPLRRALIVTSALARLAERGLTPDALVRTCLGPALVRRIVIVCSALWTSFSENDSARQRLSALEGWFVALDTEPGLAAPGASPLPDVAVTALQGAMGAAAREWIESASIADLIDWRLDGRVETTVRSEDLILPAGADATRWVFDRFTSTYLDDWERPALEWELVFRYDPGRTAERVGLPLALLEERPVSVKQIVDAMARRLTGEVGDDPIDGRLRAAELVETIVILLRGGDQPSALQLAQRAARTAPGNQLVLNALAFCLIPADPGQARQALDRLTPGVHVPPQILAINRASTFLLERDAPAAAAALEGFPPGGDNGGWLWDPEELAAGRATLRYFTFDGWRQQALETLASLTG